MVGALLSGNLTVAVAAVNGTGAPSGTPPRENWTAPVGASGSAVPGTMVAVTESPRTASAVEVCRKAIEPANWV